MVTKTQPKRAGKGKDEANTGKAVEVLEIAALDIQFMTIGIVGDSMLVHHQWSKKSKDAIKDKQAQKADKGKRPKRKPKEEYEASLYRHPEGGYGFPAIAFKNAAVDACSHVDGLTKVLARGAFHVVGDMVKIEGKPKMREDMVRVGQGTADVRYRGEFTTWKCNLTIRYNARSLSAERIVNLFNIAGFAIGVGEWRPQKNGSWGMFHVA